jgi:hypothetical protein
LRHIFINSTDETSKDAKIITTSETILHGLRKYTNYSMQVLAFTAGGDGVKSVPVSCHTEQDGNCLCIIRIYF